jgi:hypothetical protein
MKLKLALTIMVECLLIIEYFNSMKVKTTKVKRKQRPLRQMPLFRVLLILDWQVFLLMDHLGRAENLILPL